MRVNVPENITYGIFQKLLYTPESNKTAGATELYVKETLLISGANMS
jgi:hypothetical protein